MSASLLLADRVRQGQQVKVEITASYQDLGPEYGLPWLFLFSGWSERKGDYRTRDEYRVEEIPAPGGRAFLLHRSEAAIEHDQYRAKPGDPEVPVRYGVLIDNVQDHHCECPGHASRGYCKHVDSLLALLSAGHIDRPCADREPDPVLNMAEAPF
jgi:hypothetical protein